MNARAAFLGLSLALVACGDDAATPDATTSLHCENPPPPPSLGDPDGHPEPLGAAAGEARAGRIEAAELPAIPSRLAMWSAGDFVLANDKVAIVIEDAGDSDQLDPWGGRPVGIARVSAGALVDPANFGEVALLTGRSTVVTTDVTVINDGSDGGPAIVRATGRLAPLPFLDNVLAGLYGDDLADVPAAIDYVLAPDAEAVDIRFVHASPRLRDVGLGRAMHAFFYFKRMPPVIPGKGFIEAVEGPWFELIDHTATSWAYQAADGPTGSTIATSGFIGTLTEVDVSLPACSESSRAHARLVIGGPGLDGLELARARDEGRTLRTISGTLSDGTAPVAGTRVHASGAASAYYSSAVTDAAGAFTLHVPNDVAVTLTAHRRGWENATAEVAAGAGAATAPLTVARSGAIHVTAVDGTATALPVRIQVLPAGAQTLASVPEHFGELGTVTGRLHVEYDLDGDLTLPVPPGTWRVVVSRGYEYEIDDREVTVVSGVTVEVAAIVERSVTTANTQCGDFHIHTHRSFDSGDDARDKIRSALAEGVELPVRTDHEFVEGFQSIIEELGATAWAFGLSGMELTSANVWGHFGVFPLDPDPTRQNGGAVPWQRWPTAANPEGVVETLRPREVLAALRARPESPAIIINHPRDVPFDYFHFIGFDPLTGLVDKPDDWDTEFGLLEVFNDSSWDGNRAETVRDWFALLDSGRVVYAIGASDTHAVRTIPLGYPRTCIEVGTDNPAALTPELVRDQLIAGHITVSGGVYLDVAVGSAGPGDTVTGAGTTAVVDIKVQAATWIDVDTLEIVVDGVTVDTIPITPDDADPLEPSVRYVGQVTIDVAAAGSYLVVAADGDQLLEPVHPGRQPFGMSNPIWLER